MSPCVLGWDDLCKSQSSYHHRTTPSIGDTHTYLLQSCLDKHFRATDFPNDQSIWGECFYALPHAQLLMNLVSGFVFYFAQISAWSCRSWASISPKLRHLAEPISQKNGNALGICMHYLFLICLPLQASQHQEQLCTELHGSGKLLYLWQSSSFFCCQRSGQM